jgi:hypothetical protein
MKRLSIAWVAFWGLTACARPDGMDGPSGVGRGSAELLLLLLVGVVLYFGLSGLVARLSRRAYHTEASFDLASRRVWKRRKRHRRRRSEGPVRDTDRSAAAVESVTRPRAPFGRSGESG